LLSWLLLAPAWLPGFPSLLASASWLPGFPSSLAFLAPWPPRLSWLPWLGSWLLLPLPCFALVSWLPGFLLASKARTRSSQDEHPKAPPAGFLGLLAPWPSKPFGKPPSARTSWLFPASPGFLATPGSPGSSLRQMASCWLQGHCSQGLLAALAFLTSLASWLLPAGFKGKDLHPPGFSWLLRASCWQARLLLAPCLAPPGSSWLLAWLLLASLAPSLAPHGFLLASRERICIFFAIAALPTSSSWATTTRCNSGPSLMQPELRKSH
jgi:hypothetical protein